MKRGCQAWLKEILLCFPRWPKERRNTKETLPLRLEELRLLTEGLEEDRGKTWSEEDTNEGKLREASLS